ncbi:MAG TPA: PEP-CTERM sorting domain-containing protein [Chthoniobacterales bacterium]
MKGKRWGCSFVICLCLAVGTVAAQAGFQRVSPNNSGFTMLPIAPGDSREPPQPIDPIVPGGFVVDPTAAPATVAAVPEPTTVAMTLFGASLLAGVQRFRRKRRP